MATFGERLKELRKSKGYTQQQLADVFSLSKSSISRYEKELQLPETSTLPKLAEFFGVSLDYLMGNDGDDNMNPCDTDIGEIVIPEEYLSKYKVTSRDKKQYVLHLKQVTEAFFMNKEFDEEDKKEILDAMTEIFWQAKAMNKRKK